MADSVLDPARRRRNKRINAKWAKRMNRMAKPERCNKCGALIALVGRVHRCEPPAPGRAYTKQERCSPVVLIEALQRKVDLVKRKVLPALVGGAPRRRKVLPKSHKAK